MIFYSPWVLGFPSFYFFRCSSANPVDWLQTTLYIRVLVITKKRMKKAPIFRCTFLHQYLVINKQNSLLHPSPFQKCIGILLKSHCWQRNIHYCFVGFVLSGPTPEDIYLLLEISRFLFFFVNLKNQRARIEFIMIYNMNKNHWLWESVLNFYKRILIFSYKDPIWTLKETYHESNWPWSNWSQVKGRKVQLKTQKIF